LNILYVEDNEDLRHAIAMLLESDDRAVVSCADAEEALGLLGQRSFDVLVTDVSLPGLSGLELARRVLHDEPQHWVILCSGHALDDDLRSVGANVRALTKPFEIDDLERLLDGIAANRGAPDHAGSPA
jgi:CheY-like chemotaxis protein